MDIRRYRCLAAPLILCAAGCAGDLRLAAPEPWGTPIEGYIEVGDAAFPDGYDRDIKDLYVYRDMLWIGYGDATRNMGSATPVEFTYCTSPTAAAPRIAPVAAEGQGAPQRTEGDTGEEQVGHFRLLTVDGESTLWQAGIDSTDADELWTQAKPAPERLIEGNVFRLDWAAGEPVWTKFRSVAGGEHVHDIAEFDGALWAVGSGSDHRGEWEGGEIFRYLWRSDDGGASFRTYRRFMYPDLAKGDTRFRRLLVIGDTLYAFGYVNPFVDGGPLEGRHLAVARGGEVRDLDASISPYVVVETWNLGRDRGLVITREADETPSRAFFVDTGGFRELADWSDVRIRDCTAGPRPDDVLLLIERRTEPATFAVVQADARTLTDFDVVLELGETAASSIVLWQGDLYIGTNEGEILRACADDRERPRTILRRLRR